MAVDELSKPVGAWCAHCAIGKGCKIYADRPETCKGFQCGYLMIDGLGPHWYPLSCKMVLYAEENRLVIRVDEGRSDAWKQEPYYSELRQQAQNSGSGWQIIVVVGTKSFAIVPQGHVELGVVKSTDVLVTIEHNGGRNWTVEKMNAADPRVGGLKPGTWVNASDLP
jgi:hypothetical protein